MNIRKTPFFYRVDCQPVSYSFMLFLNIPQPLIVSITQLGVISMEKLCKGGSFLKMRLYSQLY